MVGPSPMPLTPSGLSSAGTTLNAVVNDGRSSARGSAKSMKLPLSSWPLASSQTTRSSSAWPMPCAMPPCSWPVDDQRVEHAAGVGDHHVAEDLDPPGRRVDLDLAELAARGKARRLGLEGLGGGERRGRAARRPRPPRTARSAGRCRGSRSCRPRTRRRPRPPRAARRRAPAPARPRRGRPGPRRRRRSARSASRGRRSPTAIRSVSPSTTRTAAGATPSTSAATWAKTVAWPMPKSWVPTCITTSPPPSIRTSRELRRRAAGVLDVDRDADAAQAPALA